MEKQQNVQQPHGTTWWNHSSYTGVRPSALHCLQQVQAGASSASSAQPLASKQDFNGTASSGSVSSPQLPHCAISSQVPAGSTRNVTGDVSTSLAEAATQLSFLEFLQRCNLLIAPPPRPQPCPTLLLDAAAQTFPHSAASADETTQLPLTEFFLGCIYSKDPLHRSVPPPTHGNANSASLAPTHRHRLYLQSQQHQPHQWSFGPTCATPLYATASARSRGSSPLSSSHGIPVKAAPVRPCTHTPLSASSPQPYVSSTQVGTHADSSTATYKRSASTALAGTHHAIGADPRAGRVPFPKPRTLALSMVKFGHTKSDGLGHINTADDDSCITNTVSQFFSGTQAQRAETPPTSSQRLADGFVRLSFKKQAIMSLTSPISSLRTLATRTSQS